MNNIEIFFFIWIGFATIKSVIVFATALDLAFFAKKENRIGNIVGAIISSTISSIGISIFWPRLLYNQKLDFFKFPDKEYIQHLLVEFEKN